MIWWTKKSQKFVEIFAIAYSFLYSRLPLRRNKVEKHWWKKQQQASQKRLLSEVIKLVLKDLSSFMSNEFHSATSNMTVLALDLDVVLLRTHTVDEHGGERVEGESMI